MGQAGSMAMEHACVLAESLRRGARVAEIFGSHVASDRRE